MPCFRQPRHAGRSPSQRVFRFRHARQALAILRGSECGESCELPGVGWDMLDLMLNHPTSEK